MSLQNANALVEAAKLLIVKASFGHSCALSTLAIEECGKAILLLGVYKGKTKLDDELYRIIFRNHGGKLYMALLELALSENFPKDEIEYIMKLVPKIDKVKQRGLYVDYIEDCEKWVTPLDSELDKMAKVNLAYAERIYESVRNYSKREDK